MSVPLSRTRCSCAVALNPPTMRTEKTSQYGQAAYIYMCVYVSGVTVSYLSVPIYAVPNNLGFLRSFHGTMTITYGTKGKSSIKSILYKWCVNLAALFLLSSLPLTWLSGLEGKQNFSVRELSVWRQIFPVCPSHGPFTCSHLSGLAQSLVGVIGLK